MSKCVYNNLIHIGRYYTTFRKVYIKNKIFSNFISKFCCTNQLIDTHVIILNFNT